MVRQLYNYGKKNKITFLTEISHKKVYEMFIQVIQLKMIIVNVNKNKS